MAKTLHHEISGVQPFVGSELQLLRSEVERMKEEAKRQATEAKARDKELLEMMNDFVHGDFKVSYTTPRKTTLVMGSTNRREKSPVVPPPPRLCFPPVILLGAPASPAPSVLEAFVEADQVPKYRFNRNLSTLPDMWRNGR